MKSKWLLYVSALLLAVVVPKAQAILVAGDPTDGSSFIFNFDENGHGQINVNGGGFTNLTGTLMPDPTQGGLPVLTYLLPTAVFGGDVQIWEDDIGGTLSDVLRFCDAQGNFFSGPVDRMIFYSDLAEAGELPDLADTGIPGTLVPNDFGGTVETGVEGNNSFTWVAGGPLGHTYNGVSDVPEPSALALLCLAATGLLRGRRK